jgi:hypothetical protein
MGRHVVNDRLRFDFWYLAANIRYCKTTALPTVEFDQRPLQAHCLPASAFPPISERTCCALPTNIKPQPQMHFTSQQDSDDANVSDPPITVGNPSLEPRTPHYEVGLSHSSR